LVQYQAGQWDSEYYQNGRLNNLQTGFFQEIYLECELRQQTIFPDQDQDILRAENHDDAWILRWDRHGYLVLARYKTNSLLAVSKLPVAVYVDNSCRVGLVISNPAWCFRNYSYVNELFRYCRIQLLASRNTEDSFKVVADVPLETPEMAVVPSAWEIPSGSPLISFKAYNTARYELWNSVNDPDGPVISTDFTACSRAFSAYNATEKTVTIFTGPEFIRSQSYWLYCLVQGAVPGLTKLRMHLSCFSGMPNMAPVFFWSRDRKVWQKIKLLEPTDDRERFCPLLLAPAENFYLSSSIPFVSEERRELLEWAKSYSGIKIMEIGKSPGNIPIELLKISDWTVDDAEKQHFMFIIGQHSPQEMIGAHCMRALLQELLTDAGLSKKWRFTSFLR
jgi:hypothetical protein